MKRRTIFLILLVALLHIALSIYLLIGNLNFIFPGTYGFDPVDSETAVIFGKSLFYLGMPLFTPFLYPFGTYLSGMGMWILLGLNSLLWGAVIVGIYKLIDMVGSGKLGFKSSLTHSRDKNAG